MVDVQDAAEPFPESPRRYSLGELNEHEVRQIIMSLENEKDRLEDNEQHPDEYARVANLEAALMINEMLERFGQVLKG